MKRLWRIAFNGLAAMSTLLCMATLILWIRSYFVTESVSWRRPYELPPTVATYWCVGSDKGSIIFFWLRVEFPALLASEQSGWQIWNDQMRALAIDGLRYRRSALPDLPNGFLGFRFLNDDTQVHMRFTEERRYVIAGPRVIFAVPYWFLSLLSCVLPLFQLRKRTRKRKRAARLQQGKCVSCGYDLRASVERCPECGTERAVPI